MKKNLLLINVLILLVLTTFAQNGFTSYPMSPYVQYSQTRNALKIDPSGNKWIAMDRVGLKEFDGTNWTTYDTLNSGIASNRVYDLDFASAGVVWIGTSKGLSKFDGAGWTTYTYANSGLPSDTVLTVFVDNTDIWVGTQRGLAKYNGSTWTAYTTSNSGLVNNKVHCIAKDASNKIWVGTAAGLSVKSGSTWITYNQTNSYMPITEVYDIYIDASNIKWIGTAVGLYKYDNATFYSLHSLFFTTDFVYSYAIFSISKGPQGGILTNSLYEILPNEIHQYTLPNGYSSRYIAFDNSTGLVWFVAQNNNINNNAIFSFDYQNYTGTTLLPQIQGYNSLDINEVRAGLMNRGDMFWDGSNQAEYEVPKNSGISAKFASALWIGGIDDGGLLHQASVTYRQSGVDYWPGPLDTISGSIDSATSESFNKIWKIDRLNIEEFKTNFLNGSVQNGTYTVSNDILTWPAVGTGNITRDLAPFVDMNADGLYNPLTDGDYPKITGDQMCYWIFNDNLVHQSAYMSPPLKVEIHASAYAYTCSQITDSLNALNYTTFYNFEIYNRGSDNFHDTYIGDWDDGDLGYYGDDFVGCNPTLNYGFEYNGTLVDGSGQINSYGAKPPMISTVVLNGPLAEANDSIDNNNNGVIDEVGEKNLMTSFLYYGNSSDPVNGNVGNGSMDDYYQYSSGQWLNGTPITYGGNGYGGAIPTNFMFDAPPGGAGWNEANAGNNPNDRRFVMGCGPFNLNAGEHVNYKYAIVWTRDTVSTYSIGNLYAKNLADVQKVQQWYAEDNYPSCYDLQAGVNTVANNNNSFSLYPNPASTQITIAYKAQTKNARMEIYNATGQKINTFNYFNQLQTIDISDFSNGLYLIKITDGKNSSVQRFVKN